MLNQSILHPGILSVVRVNLPCTACTLLLAIYFPSPHMRPCSLQALPSQHGQKKQPANPPTLPLPFSLVRTTYLRSPVLAVRRSLSAQIGSDCRCITAPVGCRRYCSLRAVAVLSSGVPADNVAVQSPVPHQIRGNFAAAGAVAVATPRWYLMEAAAVQVHLAYINDMN